MRRQNYERTDIKLGEDWLTVGKALSIAKGNTSLIITDEAVKKISESWTSSSKL
ncbi:hypothetical protein Q2T40_02570 [Winogradskyella maritima]|nr:hypothetical protein [Winogradskyella maritima]